MRQPTFKNSFWGEIRSSFSRFFVKKRFGNAKFARKNPAKGQTIALVAAGISTIPSLDSLYNSCLQLSQAGYCQYKLALLSSEGHHLVNSLTIAKICSQLSTFIVRVRRENLDSRRRVTVVYF